jgi:hypothetical protein
VAAARYDLIVDQGSDYLLRIPVLNEFGQPVTVTGWTVSGQIRAPRSASTVLQQLDVVPNGTYVELRIPRATSSAWTWVAARYDVELVSTDGTGNRLIEGGVYVRPEVTRA